MRPWVWMVRSLGVSAEDSGLRRSDDGGAAVVPERGVPVRSLTVAVLEVEARSAARSFSRTLYMSVRVRSGCLACWRNMDVKTPLGIAPRGVRNDGPRDAAIVRTVLPKVCL